MKGRLSSLGLVFIMGTLILNGCAPTTQQPTESPTATAAAVEGPDPVRARDAALVYVFGHYGEQAPSLDLTWTETRTTPEGLVGAETFEYTAGDWVITISYPIVAPEAVVYGVVVVNQTTGFQWEGEVDASGRVTEQLLPAAGDLRPLSPAACSDLADAVAQTLSAATATTQAPIQDMAGKAGNGCQITAGGTGLDFESVSSVAEEVKATLEARGWHEDTIYQADGPARTARGFRKDGGLCLLSVGWEPSEDADCPTDQPINACELAPDQQLYSIVLNCAEGAAGD